MYEKKSDKKRQTTRYTRYAVQRATTITRVHIMRFAPFDRSKAILFVGDRIPRGFCRFCR